MKFLDFDFSQKIGIYGFGVEGKSLFSWLKKHNAKDIFLFDDTSSNLQELNTMQIIFRSPGVHPNKILKYIGRENSEKISSSTQLFLEICPTKNIIGVTGTKGKGTTSSLITQILQAEFSKKNKTEKKQVFLGGNIGTPVFDFFDTITENDIVVLEMSSFQLYDIKKSPHISIVLRTDTEHLDWHSDISDYRNAKKNIFLHQKKGDICIYFAESTIVQEMISALPKDISKREVFLKNRNHTLHTIHKKNSLNKLNKYIEISDSDEIIGTVFPEISEKIPLSDIQLRGAFHQENVLPAIAVAKYFAISNTVIRDVLQKFSGLPMRCERIETEYTKKRNIQFFNDSFSTIPETSISAISILTTPLYLILGGSDKNSHFSELAKKCSTSPHIKKIYLIGETASKISKDLKKNGFLNFSFVENFEEIFDDFSQNSQSGDSLLLSPACASFGMFSHYKERGEKFNTLVKRFR